MNRSVAGSGQERGATRDPFAEGGTDAPVRLFGAPDALRALGSAATGKAEPIEVDELSSVRPGEQPAVLLLSSELLETTDDARRLGKLPAHVVVLAADGEAAAAAGEVGRLFLRLPDAGGAGESSPTQAIRAALRHARARAEAERIRERLGEAREALRHLNRIGTALMVERDPDRLLDLILERARRLTASDAGSLYLVEEVEPEERDGGDGEPGDGAPDRSGEEGAGYRLHFLRAQNDSIPELPEPDFTLPLSRSSVSGYAALSGEPLVLDDVYAIPDDEPYAFNRSFDEEFGYRARSMLVVPMIDHRDRRVGVIQLINRKLRPDAKIRTESDVDQHVTTYTDREVELVRSLAGQAAVSIENTRLYQEIEELFEGFVEAAVTAIDQRDPATSGHSVRVTELTCALARVVDRQAEGRFAGASFSRQQMKELRYAGLLHDFGKVGVREEVLTKRKKLPPEMRARLEIRFRRIRDLCRAHFERDRAERLEARGRDGYDAWLAGREARLEEELERADRYLDVIRRADEPRPLPEEGPEVLEEMRDASVDDLTGEEVPFLTDDELHYLRIPRGNLDEDELKQIQSHVLHGYDFLQQIPWPDELERVDDIMIGHHEKLNGRGYPRGVTADEIPLETRMMTVADIFDALTAADRPYKKAMPVERALEILKMEAGEGALDADLVELFIESRVYERVLEVDWREL